MFSRGAERKAVGRIVVLASFAASFAASANDPGSPALNWSGTLEGNYAKIPGNSSYQAYETVLFKAGGRIRIGTKGSLSARTELGVDREPGKSGDSSPQYGIQSAFEVGGAIEIAPGSELYGQASGLFTQYGDDLVLGIGGDKSFGKLKVDLFAGLKRETFKDPVTGHDRFVFQGDFREMTGTYESASGFSVGEGEPQPSTQTISYKYLGPNVTTTKLDTAFLKANLDYRLLEKLALQGTVSAGISLSSTSIRTLDCELRACYTSGPVGVYVAGTLKSLRVGEGSDIVQPQDGAHTQPNSVPKGGTLRWPGVKAGVNIDFDLLRAR